MDCHGHYTTAPQALWDWRKRQASGEKISEAALEISDDDIRDSLEQAQLKLQRERGSDWRLRLEPARARYSGRSNSLRKQARYKR